VQGKGDSWRPGRFSIATRFTPREEGGEALRKETAAIQKKKNPKGGGREKKPGKRGGAPVTFTALSTVGWRSGL